MIRSIGTLEQIELLEEKKLFHVANKEQGKLHEERISINHLDHATGKVRKIGVCEDLNVFMQFGHGAFMYFTFVKYTTVMLFFMSLVAIGPIYLNYSGGGLDAKANLLSATSLGNLKLLSLNDGAAQILGRDTSYIEKKTDEYKGYSRVYLIYDLAICLIFLVYYNWLLRIFKKYAYLIEAHNLTAADYTLEVSNLPERVIRKRELKDFFQKTFAAEVITVGFAYKFNNTIENFKRLGDLQVDKRIVEIKYANKKEIYDEKMENINEEIKKNEDILREKRGMKKDAQIDYRKGVSSFEGLPVIKAFVTFENSNAPDFILKATKRQRKKVCCCGKGELHPKYKFDNHDLDLSYPDHPINIKWENLEYTKCQRRMRTLLVFLATFIMIIICFAVILVINVYTKKPVNSEDCTNEQITLADLEAIPKTDVDYEFFTTCYCKHIDYTELLGVASDHVCNSFRNYIIKTYGFSFLSAVVIFITNYLLKIILTKFSAFQKYPNETLETSSNTIKNLITIYLNTVLVTIFSTADIYGFQPAVRISNILGIDQTNLVLYSDFYRDWYVDTGVKVLTTMLIAMFSPHLNNLVFQPVYRCLKRRKISNAKLQIELNKAVEPYPFNIASRYSLALNVLFVTLTFCGGMPILLWTCLFAFLLIYWCNKRMFVKWTKKPPYWSVQLAENVLHTLPYALIIHLCVSIWTYGNQEIFIHLQDGNIIDNLSKSITNAADFEGSTIDKFKNAWPLTLLLAVILAYYVLTRIVFGSLGLVFCSCKKNKVDSEGEILTGKSSLTQGGFKQNFQALKFKSTVSTYDIRDNPKYKSIILLLDLQNGQGGQLQPSTTLNNRIGEYEKGTIAGKGGDNTIPDLPEKRTKGKKIAQLV